MESPIGGGSVISRALCIAAFAIILAFVAEARQVASVRIASPNGGEQWIAGAQWTISWTATGTFTKFELHLSLDNGATWSLISSPAISSASYSWQIPAVTNASQCRIRITGYFTGGQQSDVSDAHFSILPETSQSTILFSGRSWRVETGLAAPAGNLWWNSTKSVWVDQAGNLHLRLRKIGNQWYCAEISTQVSLGYGEYRFLLFSNVENLDPNIVVGFFLYASDTREYDIEFSRWKNRADSTVGSFTVQGTTQYPRVQSDFRMGLRSDTSTHRIVWSKDSVLFESYRGHTSSIPSPEALIHRWTYVGRNNFIPGSERTYMNIWLAAATPPTDLSEAELVVKSFTFVPAIPSATEEQVLKTNWLLDIFPNPLNPSSTVRFSLGASGAVRLTFYDALGREVERLVDEELPAGAYERKLGASHLPSGIYFCRLQANGLTLTRKAVVLK